MSTSPLPPLAQTVGRVCAWILGGVLVLAVLAAAWIGVRGALAYGHLSDAQQSAAGAAEVLRDPSAAAALVSDLSADTRAARDLTSDPIWTAAEALPWIGPQLDAVGTVAAAIDDVASEALTPLTDVAAGFSIDALRPVEGRIDLAAFSSISAAARAGADGLSRAATSVGAIDDTALLGPVRQAVTEVSDLLDSTSQTTDALARATTLLPAMLGETGPRNYLIVFQNNAEWRSLGGIVGAMAVIQTDNGALSLTEQGSSSDFRRYDGPVLPLSPEIVGIFGNRPAQWIQNVTQVPVFSLTGQLAREMWLREKGLAVDGVISMDPVALSYLLAATGPVDLPTGEQLTADNAVSLLLNEVYLRYENPADQDAFFAAAAAAVFAKVAAGVADPAALVTALGRAGEERRLLMWSALPEDQAVLADTTLVGPLPVTNEDQLGFGVYLNDGTGSKMDYYVDADTTLVWDTCTRNADDTATGSITLTLTLTNTAPADAATSLPDYITGGGGFGTEPGIAKTVGYLYLPPETELTAATMSDGSGFGGGIDAGRQVLSFSTDLDPGEATTVSLTVRTKTPGAQKAVAWVTPTVHPDIPTSIGDSCTAD
ncbi:DUF4012 domain-containing protein [uncultured Microbacterium sp.]|uniref:DUF4012 domain-containing protein n=1 Tax=uncultured Microbacterium sp. TaxID=191216 RepID=UPI002611F089|nr:DUF4012 domain-containing protein [uncultured Microbacterium sp.]